MSIGVSPSRFWGVHPMGEFCGPEHCASTHCRPGRTLWRAKMNRRQPNTVTLKLSALAAGMLFSGISLADARIPADLVQTLASTSPTKELTVVVSYNHSGPITVAELAAMKSIG